MDDLLDLFALLEHSPGPVVLATLLKGNGGAPAGTRRILDPAQPAAQEVLVSGRTQVLTGELDGWQGGPVMLERMVPGKLPPWVHFCGQVLRRGGHCVLATVGVVEGHLPYAVGDRFVYDERDHGLLPMDGRFSLELQRGCRRAREAGQPGWQRFDLDKGTLGICLELLGAVQP